MLKKRLPLMLGTRPDIPAFFPHTEWNEQSRLYDEYWDWFDGAPWQEKDYAAQTASGEAPEKYPLQINPTKIFSQIHASVVMGEVQDGPDPIFKAVVQARRDGGKKAREEWKDEAHRAEDFINQVWTENNGRSIQAEATLVSQFLGGSVYRTTFSPSSDRPSQIRIEYIYPDYFLPVYSSTDYLNLHEAYHTFQIPAREAQLAYRVANPSSDHVLYLERWTKNDREITVDGKPVNTRVNGIDTGKKNPFGFVPFTYIPTIRAGGFYGMSLVTDIKGICREYNARLADLGDAVAESVDGIYWGRNLRGNLKEIDLGRLTVYDLGAQPIGSAANGSLPDVWRNEPTAISSSIMSLPENLWKILLRVSRLAPIAFGEDEGSQRSALTLAFRMWPLTSRSATVRMHLSAGLNQISWFILKIAKMKGLLDLSDDYEQHLHVSYDFAPMIPRDREQEQNTAILATQTGIMGPKTAMRVIGQTKDPESELRDIFEWMKHKNEIDAAGSGGDIDESPAMDTEEPVAMAITE